MRETQPAVLLERKTDRLRASTGNLNLRSKLARPNVTPQQVLIKAFVRPTMLLIRSPVLLAISLYVAMVFGTMYLLFTTFVPVFEGQYGFTTTVSGLTYLGLGVALVAAMVTFTILSTRIQTRRMRIEDDQQPRPENRLLLMIYFSPLVGVGLIFYGWTVEYKVHWIVPIIGTFVIGFGAYFVLVRVATPPLSGAKQSNRSPFADACTAIPSRSVWFGCCCFSPRREQSPTESCQHLPAAGWTSHVRNAQLRMGKYVAGLPRTRFCPGANYLLQVRRKTSCED